MIGLLEQARPNVVAHCALSDLVKADWPVIRLTFTLYIGSDSDPIAQLDSGSLPLARIWLLWFGRPDFQADSLHLRSIHHLR